MSVYESELSSQWNRGGVLGVILATVVGAFIIQTIMKLVNLVLQRRASMKALAAFSGPPPHWLFGNLKAMEFNESGLNRQVEWAIAYPSAVKLFLGPIASLTCSSPEYIKSITSTSEPKDTVVYRFVRPWIGDGLLLSKGSKWARNRRLLTPSFHFDILRPYTNVFNECANIMVNKWKEAIKKDKSIEMFESVSLMTLDSLMKCIFGCDNDVQNEGKHNPYIQSVYDLTELVVKRFRFFPYHSDLLYALSWSGYRFRKACKVAHDFTNGVIISRKKEKASGVKLGDKDNTRKYLDFLDIILECRDEEGNGLTDQEIRDEVDTFMFEGHDTTASGISWVLYNLAKHPEYQQRCREEVNEVLQGGPITWDNLGELSYLAQCIKESMRLHPPVTNIAREITKPLQFPDGRSVPAGTIIGISVYAVHHNPEVWSDPETYDPDRFSVENSKGRHSHAFVPFSAGPRNCIGQNFAMNEMKVCMAVVLQHFELCLDDSRPPVRIPELILRTKDGLWLKLKEIK